MKKKSFMYNMTIKTMLATGFGVILIVLGVMVGVGVSGLNDANDGFSDYRRLARDNDRVSRIQASVLNMRLSNRGYLGHTNDKYVNAFDEASNECKEILKEGNREMKDADDLSDLKSLEEFINQYDQGFRKMVEAAKVSDAKKNEAYEAFTDIAPKINKIVVDMKARVKKEQDEMGPKVKAEIDKDSSTIETLAFLAAVLGVGAALGIGIYLSREVSNIASIIGSASEQLLTASGEVSSASTTLAEGASEQAASIEETSASVEELSSMTRKNSENADTGAHEMGTTKEVSEQSFEKMKMLSSAMTEMSKIVKSIDEIAFQTNILALNAAVEAARAGEAGMGFAVVADEVRNLAKRSADAAKETSNKIELAVTLTRDVSRSMDEMVLKTNKVDALISEISSASKEQSQGIEQITLAMNQLDKVTQSNAASSEETASAAQELSAQAQGMQDAVVTLESLCGMSRQRNAFLSGKISMPKARALKTSVSDIKTIPFK